jgi:hypothetical protein
MLRGTTYHCMAGIVVFPLSSVLSMRICRISTEFPRNNYLIIIYRMVKKIKVVEMNTSNQEAIQEQEANMQARDPTPMQEVAQAQEAITQDQEPAIIKEGEPKAKKPRAPRAPKAPKEKVQAPPPSDSDSIDTEEMIAVIKNHRASKKQPVQAQEPPPEPPVEQAQAPQAPTKEKQEEKATCPDCHKVMSAKSLKYSHANNCKARAPPKQEPVKMVEAVEPSKPVAHPISVLMAAERAMRMGQRRQRIESLLSHAF